MQSRKSARRESAAVLVRSNDAVEVVAALHQGEADALVVQTARGEDIYTLESVNRPYRLFVEQMQEGAVSICNEGLILYCNARFADMVGGLTTSIIGRNLDEFVAGSSIDDYRSLRERGCRETARGECNLKQADGSLLRVQMTFSQLRPLRMGHCTVIVTDLTHVERQKELSAAMEAAEQANVAKDRFLAMLSHELRTPLSAVLGWSQMLRKGTLSEEDTARGLEAIERNARSQLQLISDLLDVSRIVAGKLRLDTALVRPSEVVADAMETITFAAQQKGVHLSCAMGDHAALVHADPERLRQAVANLLNNAVKFTPGGGHVRVRLKRMEGEVEITVSDTGQGISAEDMPLIFGRFKQAKTQSEDNTGLGLGLYLVKQVIKMQGGEVTAYSAGPGRGAAFTIRLPIAAVELKEVKPDRGRPSSGVDEDLDSVTLEGVHVLIIDDAPDSLSMMEVALSGAGAKVTGASSAAEGFALVHENQPDIIISDLSMPAEDGFEFIRRVRRAGFSGRDLPAIALTAMARPEDRRRALLAGYQLHVSKPVDNEELIAAVAGVATLAAKPA